ncbi:MAG: hypothetical protein V7L29_25310 [Nostoc sp.]|uniref:hypothetical protein n=1 Tax=Nostoc sp. TaxID=1180 RepID=UPI002FF0820F
MTPVASPVGDALASLLPRRGTTDSVRVASRREAVASLAYGTLHDRASGTFATHWLPNAQQLMIQ